MIKDMIENTTWPEFLKQWHKDKIRITTTNIPTIGEALINVTRAAWLPKAFKCGCRNLRERCPEGAIIDGHAQRGGVHHTKEVSRHGQVGRA